MKNRKSKSVKERKPKINYQNILSNYIKITELSDGLISLRIDDKEQYAAVLQISGCDIFTMHEGDREDAYHSFATATMSLTHPHKYVFSTSKPSLQSQIEFLQYKRDRAANPFCEHILDNELRRAEQHERTQFDKVAYLLIFGNKPDRLIDEGKRYINSMRDAEVQFCGKDELKAFVSNYTHQQHGEYGMLELFPEVIRDKQSYAIIDDKRYVTYISVDGYPSSILDLQFAQLVSINGCTITLDVSFKERERIRHDLDQSIDELQSRGQIQQGTGDLSDAIGEAEKLLAIRDDIVNGNEHMVFGTLRYILSSDSYDDLARQVEDVKLQLDDKGLHGSIAIDNIVPEYCNMLKPADTCGIPFPMNNTFSRQYPFYYQRHLDPKGTYVGRTVTGGLVYADTFMRGHNRESYDMLITGKKGSGKTINLKKIIEMQVALGNKCMVLDVESEYATMAAVLDGQVIKMTKSSKINVLQIYPILDAKAEEEQSDIVAANYAANLSRIITFFYQYNPSMKEKEADKLKDLLQETYALKCLDETVDVSRFAAARFPTISDLYRTIKNKLYTAGTSEYNKALTDAQIETLESLELMIKPLAHGGTYGSMFDGYTDVVVGESNLVVFDVKVLSGMEERVYNAQLFLILNLMWNATCKNVAYNNNINNANDRRYVLSFIDEAHRFINANNLNVTAFIETQVRRSRKYDASLVFASQSALDFAPADDSAAAKKIGTIFELVQYKIIMSQSVSEQNIERLHKLFPQFTIDELSRLKDFAAGEMYFALDDSRQKFRCARATTNADLFYMGNSRDRERIIKQVFQEHYGDQTAAEFGASVQSEEALKEFCETFFGQVLDALGVPIDASESYDELVVNEVIKLADGIVQSSERSSR